MFTLSVSFVLCGTSSLQYLQKMISRVNWAQNEPFGTQDRVANECLNIRLKQQKVSSLGNCLNVLSNLTQGQTIMPSLLLNIKSMKGLVPVLKPLKTTSRRK